jgi:dihydroorotate dehydrogenase (NAD+) catalytic subunit
VEEFLAHDLPWLAEHRVRAVVSIAGHSVEDYVRLATKLRGKAGLAMIEVNISCPNVEDRGQVFACDPRAAADVVSAVRRVSSVPVLAKLSPDVTDIVAVAGACLDAGATGLTLINTLLGLSIDTTTMRPTLAGTTGGLSGPAMRPVALRCVWQVHAAYPEAPIMGVGGIRTGLDALEFLLAGATAVQVGTAVFGDPSAPLRIAQELRAALAERGFAKVGEVVGLAHRPPDREGHGTDALHPAPEEGADPPGDRLRETES